MAQTEDPPTKIGQIRVLGQGPSQSRFCSLQVSKTLFSSGNPPGCGSRKTLTSKFCLHGREREKRIEHRERGKKASGVYHVSAPRPALAVQVVLAGATGGASRSIDWGLAGSTWSEDLHAGALSWEIDRRWVRHGSDMGACEHQVCVCGVWHGMEQKHDETRDRSDILNKKTMRSYF